MRFKVGFLAGAIAGIVSAFVNLLVGAALLSIGIIGITESFTTVEEFPFPASYILVGLIGIGIVTGIICGAIYSKLYESIPGKALSKGVCYGVIIWIIKDIGAAMYMILPWGAYYLASAFIACGLPLWLVYGAVLGTIYEKIK